MSVPIPYRFVPVEFCPMCEVGRSAFKLMGYRLNRSQGIRPKSKEGDRKLAIYRCTSCDLIFPNPIPLPVNFADHYDVLPEKYWKEKYFDEDPGYFVSESKMAIQLLNDRKEPLALDIGSGLGKGMEAMERSGFNVWGIEPSRSFYLRSLELHPEWKEKIRCCRVEEADPGTIGFDFVNFGAVLEHLQDPGLALVKGMSWLKPGGILHAEVPNSKWLVSRLINLQFNMRLSSWVMNLSPMHPPYHLHEFGLRSFQKHAELNNYSLIRFEHFVGNTYLPSLLDPLLKPLMRLTNTGLGIKVWLQKKPL